VNMAIHHKPSATYAALPVETLKLIARKKGLVLNYHSFNFTIKKEKQVIATFGNDLYARREMNKFLREYKVSEIL
jgi:hypothetical protein